MEEPSAAPAQTETYSTAHVVHALMQFALAVRHRISVVIGAVVVCALLGGLYYATATRYYAAKAQLLVLQVGDVPTTSMASMANRNQSLMNTYEKLFGSARVLEMAIQYLLPEDRIDLAEAPRDRWAEILGKSLSARTLSGSNIIEIEYRSKDPDAAVAVVNAVVRSYLEFVDATHKGTTGEVIRLLTKEKTDVTERLAAEEQQLQQIRAQLGLVGTQVNPEITHPLVQRAMSFNQSLIDAQKQRVQLEALLAGIQAAARNGEDLRQHLLETSDVVGKELLLTALGLNPRDAASQAAMDQRLFADRTRLSSLEEHFGPNHPEVVALQEEIRVTEHYLRGFQERIDQRLAELQDGRLASMLVDMVRQRVKDCRQRENMLHLLYQQATDEVNQLGGLFAALEMSEFNVKWLRDLHETLLRKLADVNLRQEGVDIRTTIVSEPVKNDQPVSPRLVLLLAMVVLGGSGAGLLLVYVLDALDDRFRSLEELQSQLGAPVLTVLRPLPIRHAVGAGALQAHVEPDAAESEPFRTLRTALSLAERQSRQMVVSSAEPGDGKTTVLANLAVCFAQSAKKTLLIDADLRRPGLTALLGMRGMDGLSGIIRGQEHVGEMALRQIRASGVDGLDVLPAGPRPTNPAELLASVRFSELLAWAESVYDQILIDSPPILAASDAALIGRLVDGLLLVVQPEKNRRRMVVRAVEGLATLKIALLGIAINRVSASAETSYYGYGYDYHYGGERDADGEPDDGRRLLGTRGDSSESAVPAARHDEDDHATLIPRRAA